MPKISLKTSTIALCLLTLSSTIQAQVWNKVTSAFTKNSDLPSINTEDLKMIRADINVLTSKEANGRKSGTKGEEFAGLYIEKRMQSAGLIANVNNEYRYHFKFESDKKLSKDCKLVIGTKYLFIPEDAVPLAFSNFSYEENNFIMPGSEEPHAPWVTPLYKNASEALNPNFDWEQAAYNIAYKAQKKGASAVVLYDEYGAANKPIYKNSSAFDPLDITVIIVNKNTYEQHIKEIKTITPIQIKVEFTASQLVATNIIGRINNNASKTIVIGASYDHLGENKTYNSGSYFTGADNNASGVALMLTLAQKIKKEEYKNYNFIFIAFSGHESGLMGSKAFLKNVDFPHSSIACMIDISKVGLLKNNKMLTIEGTGSSKSWDEAFLGITTTLAIETQKKTITNSEFVDFYHQNIPALLFTTGKNESHGTMKDMASNLNYQGIADVGTFILRFLKQFTEMNKIPEFTKIKNNDIK